LIYQQHSITDSEPSRMKMNRIVKLLLGCVLAGLMLQTAGAEASPAKFGIKWQSLIGQWRGEGASGGGGACGFHFDLSEQIIVRTNHAALPATGGRPANLHDDLMVIYPGPTEDKAKAIYFDNEGHVIEYGAEWSADGNTLTFLSKPAAGPQFRLTYKRLEAKLFSVSFDMAPPGQAAFKTYTSGKIRREGD
jgi:hypothetical protein